MSLEGKSKRHTEDAVLLMDRSVKNFLIYLELKYRCLETFINTFFEKEYLNHYYLYHFYAMYLQVQLKTIRTYINPYLTNLNNTL